MTSSATSGDPSPEVSGRAAEGRRRRQRTRLRLIQSAYELLGRPDGRNVQIDNVVQHARVARGTFYNYFESRDNLLDVMAFELNHGLDEVLAQAPDPLVRTCWAIRCYVRKAALNPAWGWAMLNASSNGQIAFGADTYRNASETIAAGMQSGHFHVPSLQTGLDLVLGTTLHAIRAVCENRTPDAHPENVAFAILLGLGVQPDLAETLIRAPLPIIDPLLPWQRPPAQKV
jgi:AcrR family transcriptional regulator